MESFPLEPIGVARTPFPNHRGMPRQGGGPAEVLVFEPFRPALLGLHRCSHLWILGFFQHAARDVLRATPRKAKEHAEPRGVFAMRSPVRPNPLGISCARIIDLLPDRIRVDRLDFADQTPILDLKPYSPGWDLVPSASSTHRYDPSRYTSDELSEAFARDADHALGPHFLDHPAVVALLPALTTLVKEHHIDLRSSRTRFTLPRADARVDLLLCCTGASFGNARLHVDSLPDACLLAVHSESTDYHVLDGSPPRIALARRRRT